MRRLVTAEPNQQPRQRREDQVEQRVQIDEADQRRKHKIQKSHLTTSHHSFPDICYHFHFGAIQHLRPAGTKPLW